MELAFMDMGTIDYGDCWKLQQELFDAILEAKKENKAAQTVLLCEHPHVYTLGKSGKEHNMLAGKQMLRRIGATYYHTDRGGDITYHGPGQLVGYPILDLERLGIGLRRYIELLEQTIINTIGVFGLEGCRICGASGVWLEASTDKPLRKICAIGVRSSRFVTMHGFALNVTTDLSYFSHINPCGFTDRGVTSIEQETGIRVEMSEVKKIFEREFGVLLSAGKEEDYKC